MGCYMFCGGRLLPAGRPTTNHGSTIDHIVVSRHLEASSSMTACWCALEPYDALMLTLCGAGQGPKVWRLQHFPKIVSQTEQEVWPAVGYPDQSQKLASWERPFDFADTELVLFLCEWFQKLEMYHGQGIVGRGWSVQPIFGDSARPVAEGLSSHAHCLHQLCSWLSSGMVRGMKPLFRAMAKGEVELDRPFRG